MYYNCVQFFLGVVNFNAKHGCLKCTTVGTFSHISNTTIFPKFDAPRRNDIDFRANVYTEHTKYPSPISELPIDMVEDFPVADVLHLIDLGVTRRLLNSWKRGLFGRKVAWSSQMQNEISAHLCACKTPNEIHRKVRGLGDLPNWKGTEFHTFLLYVGPVVLKQFLPKYAYRHFLLFHCAVTILCSEYHMSDLMDTADELIKAFLKQFMAIYGKDFVFSNMHNLCHLIDDVKRFGSLMKFSTYPFENKLQALKKTLRTNSLPLSQIGKRLCEQEEVALKICMGEEKSKLGPRKTIKIELNLLDHILGKDNYDVYEEFGLTLFTIKTTQTDKWFLTQRNELIEVKYIVVPRNKSIDALLYATKMTDLHDFFHIPFPSRVLNIYSCNYRMRPPNTYKVSDLKCKMFQLKNIMCDDDSSSDEESIDNNGVEYELVFFPLIHTLSVD